MNKIICLIGLLSLISVSCNNEPVLLGKYDRNDFIPNPNEFNVEFQGIVQDSVFCKVQVRKHYPLEYISFYAGPGDTWYYISFEDNAVILPNGINCNYKEENGFHTFSLPIKYAEYNERRKYIRFRFNGLYNIDGSYSDYLENNVKFEGIQAVAQADESEKTVTVSLSLPSDALAGISDITFSDLGMQGYTNSFKVVKKSLDSWVMAHITDPKLNAEMNRTSDGGMMVTCSYPYAYNPKNGWFPGLYPKITLQSGEFLNTLPLPQGWSWNYWDLYKYVPFEYIP